MQFNWISAQTVHCKDKIVAKKAENATKANPEKCKAFNEFLVRRSQPPWMSFCTLSSMCGLVEFLIELEHSFSFLMCQHLWHSEWWDFQNHHWYSPGHDSSHSRPAQVVPITPMTWLPDSFIIHSCKYLKLYLLYYSHFIDPSGLPKLAIQVSTRWGPMSKSADGIWGWRSKSAECPRHQSGLSSYLKLPSIPHVPCIGRCIFEEKKRYHIWYP